jgi:hypothetical protein
MHRVRCRILCRAQPAMERTKVRKTHNFNSTASEHREGPDQAALFGDRVLFPAEECRENCGELTRDIFSKPCGDVTVRLLGRRVCSITSIPCRPPLRDLGPPQAAEGCPTKSCLTQHELAPLNYSTSGAVAHRTYSQKGPSRKSGLFILLRF